MTGVIRFICETGDRALVLQTATGAAFEDGYRFVKNASFSSRAVGDTITYTYDNASATNDGYNITIS